MIGITVVVLKTSSCKQFVLAFFLFPWSMIISGSFAFKLRSDSRNALGMMFLCSWLLENNILFPS